MRFQTRSAEKGDVNLANSVLDFAIFYLFSYQWGKNQWKTDYE